VDARRAVIITAFEAVAGTELAQRLGISVGHAAEVDELGKELLEASGGDDLEDARRLVAAVPEGEPLIARLEDQIAGLADQRFVAEQRADLPLKHVAVLVLAAVAMRGRCQRARRRGRAM
jgi:hypothetical protein